MSLGRSVIRPLGRRIVPEPLLDLIRARQSLYRDWAFHGDVIYQGLMKELILAFGSTAFVETGTYLGDSSRFIAEHTSVPKVLTCEVSERYFRRARRRLCQFSNVSVAHRSSEAFIEALLQEPTAVGGRPLFYLDAHWYGYWPLADEIATIAARRLPTIVVVDDFAVPGRHQFTYDTYKPADGPPAPCDFDLIRSSMSPENQYDLLWPDYDQSDAFPNGEDRPLAGHVALFQNLREEVQRASTASALLREHYALEPVAL